MEAHTGSCGVALSSYVGQKRATDNIDVHKFNFTFKKGHYVNDLDIKDLHLDSLQVLRPAYYKFRQQAFCDGDLVSFVHYCTMNPPMEASSEAKTKHQQKRQGFHLIDFKLLSQFPWRRWIFMQV